MDAALHDSKRDSSLPRYTVSSKQTLPAGKATIRFEFAYDDGGVGKGGVGTLFVKGKEVGTGRIEHSSPTNTHRAN